MSIHWQNIYRMITYEIEELNNIECEFKGNQEIKSSRDLLAEMFIKAYRLVNKQQMLTEFRDATVSGSSPVGQMGIAESIVTGEYGYDRLIHSYQELNIDNEYNRFIKLAVRILLRAKGTMSDKRLVQVINIDEHLGNVRQIDMGEASSYSLGYWNMPEWYKPIISASKVVINTLMAYDHDSNDYMYRLGDMNRLPYIFEEFIRGYYKTSYKVGEVKTTKPVYKTVSSAGGNEYRLGMLLRSDEVACIINTKWYNRGNHIGDKGQALVHKKLFMGANTNYKSNNVNAVVIYAEDSTAPKPCREYFGITDTDPIDIRNINLDRSFKDITNQLDSIADEYFGDNRQVK